MQASCAVACSMPVLPASACKLSSHSTAVDTRRQHARALSALRPWPWPQAPAPVAVRPGPRRSAPPWRRQMRLFAASMPHHSWRLSPSPKPSASQRGRRLVIPPRAIGSSPCPPQSPSPDTMPESIRLHRCPRPHRRDCSQPHMLARSSTAASTPSSRVYLARARLPPPSITIVARSPSRDHVCCYN
ncbi:hypothetical protein B0J12DRAFT_24196 [Macrophomina phaseolina]|uniref:Uncharacterized protein n=1 Tax=Macrophomina phaseolina TaxID=35725 RepID=A0ABQ8GVE3_9PEZI|nr:hypothetical protein B0J12DRAFT_24196 [Macrophomina phaseolina]